MQSYIDQAKAFWLSLGHEVHFAIWLLSGVLFFATAAYYFYLFCRHASGYRKFRGNWFNAGQYQALLNILYEDQKAGARVMRHDELQLLRREMLGKDFKALHKGFGGYM